MEAGAHGLLTEIAARPVEEDSKPDQGCPIQDHTHRIVLKWLKQIRTCTNPTPSCGGNTCPGDSFEVADCNTNGLSVPFSYFFYKRRISNFNHNTEVVNGGWSPWSNYGACSKSCIGGIKTKTRLENDVLVAI